MPVQADPAHVPLPGPVLTVRDRRWIDVFGPDVIPLGSHEQRHIACFFNIGSPPVVFLRLDNRWGCNLRALQGPPKLPTLLKSYSWNISYLYPLKITRQLHGFTIFAVCSISKQSCRIDLQIVTILSQGKELSCTPVIPQSHGYWAYSVLPG